MDGSLSTAIELGVHLDPIQWVSHYNGRIFVISDMQDDHLLASINMIERGEDIRGNKVPDWCKDKLTTLELEASKRGILGQYKSNNTVRDGWDA